MHGYAWEKIKIPPLARVRGEATHQMPAFVCGRWGRANRPFPYEALRHHHRFQEELAAAMLGREPRRHEQGAIDKAARLYRECRYGTPGHDRYSAGNAGASSKYPRHARAPAPASDVVANTWPPLPAALAASTAEGGWGHPADTPTCPRWQEECRLATLLATAPTPLEKQSRPQHVRSTSYATAVRSKLPESPIKDPDLQRPTPSPHRCIPLPVTPSPMSPLPSLPAQPAQDPWVVLIASLLAVQRAVGETLSPEHPLRIVCLAVLSGQFGTTQLH
ncbi:hypothetical protein HPB51_023665 [Rhipicephalus microplus]|uniref:Uncharacterized protein n=1 Tax=Rhipicephalus microplus TaxID=6941 RepID=A0A9J6DJU9_RHIMP|nr:hypothetical protein HPB51_023665 [Rhipicephalus microplus]